VGIPLASDDAEALEIASRLVTDAGFDPVVVGPAPGAAPSRSVTLPSACDINSWADLPGQPAGAGNFVRGTPKFERRLTAHGFRANHVVFRP